MPMAVGEANRALTPSAASSTYVGGNYHAMVGGQAHGNFWLVDAALEVYSTPGDALLMTRGLSWSAGQAITVEPDAGAARTCTITGATTGNGAPTMAAGTIFDTSANLAVGRDYGSSAYPFAGTISNIDDTITAASGAATLTVPAAISTTGALTRSRPRPPA